MAKDLLTDFADARAQTLRTVASLSQQQLDFSPEPGRWSIGEVLDHLLRTQKLYQEELGELIALKRAGRRPYLRRSFRDINISPLFLPDAILPWLDLPFTLANRIMPDGVRDLMTQFPIVPSRNPDRATPQARRAGANLRSDLLSSLADLDALITANADLDFREMVLEHPLIGVSDVPRMLTFLANHERRHHKQVGEVRGHRRFPSSDAHA